MRSNSGDERSTYSRARTSYVEGRKGRGLNYSGKRLSSGAIPMLKLGAPQNYGIVQQLRVHSRQHLDISSEDGVGHSHLILRPPPEHLV